MNAYEKMCKALLALDAWVKVVKNNPKDTTAIECAEFVEETIRVALAEPRRNCDVGTAEERAQRFETFCSLHHLPNGKGCYSCPAIPGRSPHAFHRDACRANWNQMPYEEGGAK